MQPTYYRIRLRGDIGIISAVDKFYGGKSPSEKSEGNKEGIYIIRFRGRKSL